jgi:hypothetical protein
MGLTFVIPSWSTGPHLPTASLTLLHHQGGGPGQAACGIVRLLDAVDLRDARVTERREHFGFALEPRQPLAVAGHRRQQHFERDLALQPQILAR